MRVLAVAIVLVLLGCLQPALVTCDDGTACAPGHVCIPGGCALPDQITACEGRAEGDTCDYDGSDGRCIGGACIVATCGDGSVDLPEQCDGIELGGMTCVDLGYYSGTLRCTDSCVFDEMECAGRCGDGMLDGGESCDGAATTSCFELGLAFGRPACTGCSVNVAPCQRYAWRTLYTGFGVAQNGTLAGDAIFTVLGNTVTRHIPGTTPETWADLPLVGGNPRMSGTSSTNVFLQASRSMLHFDGTSWTEQTVPGIANFGGIHAVTATLAYASEFSGIIAMWNGTTWTDLPESPSEVSTVVGNAGGEIWATTTLGLFYFDGAEWTSIEDFGAAPVHLARSGDEVMVLFENGTIARWEGGGFVLTTTPPAMNGVTTLHPLGAGRMLAAGGLHTIYEWNGRVWGRLRPPSAVDGNAVVAAMLDNEDRLIVAGGLRLYRSDLRLFDADIDNTVIHAGNDALWGYDLNAGSISAGYVPIGSTGTPIYETWGTTSTNGDVVFISAQSNLYRCDFAGTCVAAGVTQTVAVHGTAVNDVWAVGTTAHRYDGVEWKPLDPGNTAPLLDVFARTVDDVYAITQTDVFHYNGSGWTKISGPPAPIILYAIWADANGHIVVTSSTGIHELSPGGTWSSVVTSSGLPHLAGTGLDNLYAVGARMFHRDASGWLEVEIPDLAGLLRGIQIRDDDVWLFTSVSATRLGPLPPP